MDISAEQVALAKGWFGFGSWTAPFWFVGMEPGGTHTDWARIWAEMDRPELVDCVWHCSEIGNASKYHGEKIQMTWRGPLIAKLAFNGESYDTESVRAASKTYCKTDSDTVTVELSPFAAGSRTVPRPRALHRDERVEVIRQRLRDFAPRFAIFYGITYRSDYESISGPFDADGFAWCGRTLCRLAPHPRAKSGTEYWAEIGRELRRRLSG
jgi:hypothetical protein